MIGLHTPVKEGTTKCLTLRDALCAQCDHSGTDTKIFVSAEFQHVPDHQWPAEILTLETPVSDETVGTRWAYVLHDSRRNPFSTVDSVQYPVVSFVSARSP